MRQGTWIVFGIFGLAIAAGVGAWLHQQQRGQRCLGYFGSDQATLIRFAPKVEYLQIIPQPRGDRPPEDAESGSIGMSDEAGLWCDGVRYQVESRTDLSGRPGLVHARQALIEDRSYSWESDRARANPREWAHALRFSQDGRACLVFLERSFRYLRIAENPHPLQVDETMQRGLGLFLEPRDHETPLR